MIESDSHFPPLNSTGSASKLYITNRWSRRFLQPFLITAQVVALFAGIAAVSRGFNSDTPWMSLIWLFILVSIEGIVTTVWLDAPDRRTIDRLAYRAAEVIVLILVVRLFTWVSSGQWPQFGLLTNYLMSPGLLFGDSFFLVGSLLTLLAWQRAIGLSDIFSELAIDSAEASYYTARPEERIPGNRPVLIDRSALAGALLQQWIMGAVTLIVFTALSTIDLADFSRSGDLRTIVRIGLRSDVLIILMIYFLSGLLLMSQARLAAMNARWLLAGTVKSPRVEKRWHRNTLWLVLIIAFAAAFMPLGSTIAIGHIVETLVIGVLSAFNFIFLLILALLSLLLSSANPPAASSSQPAVTLTPQAAPSALPHSQPSDLLPFVLSSLFWAVVIVAVVAAVSFFLRDRGRNVDFGVFVSIWSGVKRWFQQLRGSILRQAESVRKTIRRAGRRLPSVKRPPSPSWPILRVNSLSARQQLRYFYLSTVKRAEHQGVKRRRSETPIEYSEDLRKNWPEAVEEVDALTNAFLEARYSDKEIRSDTTNLIKQNWQRLKKLIRRKNISK